MTDSESHSQFDQRLAEEELQRIRADIEASRRRRNEAVESFDAFLRSLGSREQAPPTVKVRNAVRPGLTANALVPGLSPAVPGAARNRARVAEGPPGGRLLRRLALALLAVAVAGVVWLMIAPRTRDAERPGNADLPAPVIPGSPAASTVPAAASDFEVEITTIRPVWLRIIVDGQRMMEREVSAGYRSRLTSKETVTIRAGDAGALHVLVNGVDTGPLGRDGLPRTTTFSRPR